MIRTQEIFLISWVVIVGLLTLGSVRLPMLTALFALVEAAFVFSLLGVIYRSTGLTKTAGSTSSRLPSRGCLPLPVSMSAATGGRPYPLGRPSCADRPSEPPPRFMR